MPHARRPAFAIGVCSPAETPAGIGAAAVVPPLEAALPLMANDDEALLLAAVLLASVLLAAVLLAAVLLAAVDEPLLDEPLLDEHWATLKVFVNVHDVCAPTGIAKPAAAAAV